MESNTQKAIIQEKPGDPVKLGHIPIPKPAANQILVKMVYAAINPTDVMAIGGFYNAGFTFPFVSGWEGSGIVQELGPDCQVQHKVGDRVAVASNMSRRGVWAEYAVYESDMAWTIPPENTFEEAAYSYLNPFTAYSVLGKVKQGGHKAVVQSAANSAMGRIFIQLCKEEGIKTINLVRKEEHIKELKELGGDYVLNIQSKDWASELKNIAEEIGARVCFEYVSGETASAIISAMPKFSTIYIAGSLTGKDVIVNPEDVALFGKTITGFVFLDFMAELTFEEKRKLGERIQAELKTTFSTKVAKTFKFEEVKEAFEFYQSSPGKILLKP